MVSGYLWILHEADEERIKSEKKQIGVWFLVFATIAQGMAISVRFLVQRTKTGNCTSRKKLIRLIPHQPETQNSFAENLKTILFNP